MSGRAVEVIELGRGPRVVMVHGDVGGALDTFEEQTPLADAYTLNLVNRRGFGNSADTEGKDFEVDAADAAELFDGGVHLVGHSYGGVVSLLAAGLRPQDVRSLTVFEPPAFGLIPDHPDGKALVDTLKGILATRPTPEEWLHKFFTAVGGSPELLPSPLTPDLQKAATVQLNGRFPWDAVIPLDRLAAAPFPKLVVSGGHSAMFDAICDVLVERTGARMAVLPGAGHGIPSLGGPVNDLLREFWSSAG